MLFTKLGSIGLLIVLLSVRSSQAQNVKHQSPNIVMSGSCVKRLLEMQKDMKSRDHTPLDQLEFSVNEDGDHRIKAYNKSVSSSRAAQDADQHANKISGKCVRCLIEVRKDLKSGDHTPLDQLKFSVNEDGDDIIINVQHTKPMKGGSCEYTCSKSSGAILESIRGK